MEIIHLVSGKLSGNNALVAAINNLATEQVRLGHQVTLWEISEEANDHFQLKSYKTVLFPAKPFIWTTTRAITSAIQKLHAGVIVHIHGSFVPIYFTIAYQLRKINIPFVYTTYGMYQKEEIKTSGLLRQLYFQLFEQMLIRWSSALHITGANEKEMLAEAQTDLDKKLFLIPNGLTNENRLIPPKIKRTDEPVFGFCGRLDIHAKGLDILLRAFAEYKLKYFEKGVLWIIGDGEGKEVLYEMANELGIHAYVSFKGNMYGLRKFEMMSKIDVFVRPSRVEHFPSAILEAASSSVPSIVSRATNMGDYITQFDAGYVLVENTPNALAKLFLKAYQDIKQYRWDHKRRNAFRMVNEKFQWSRIAEEHIHVYEKVLDQQAA
ncbi:MAG: glycosyltransferase family 4 protein [Sediminibacterium sp.]|nr:glycosyltransferase family 4 protein [Sediminibacterium sp.]MBX9778828.1 glycosyltransferase family 4 protein [Chitinophagaceae bacterium]